jgi:hypothetical protein
VSKFKYLGTAIQNPNLIHEHINSILNSSNACYLSVIDLLSSHPLSKSLNIKIYKTVILPLVLYRFETWSLTLREAYRLRVFENRLLRRISRPKKGEMIGGWITLHKEELHNLYSSPNIIRMVKSMRIR